MTKFLFFICLCCLGSQVSSQDTLNPGDKLDSSSPLISSNTIFTLGFYTPYESNYTYLAIQYTQNLIYPVWIGNRESAVSNNSDPVLTIDTTGTLIITHSGGETLEIFAGGAGKNATAILLDSGNFIVKDMSSNGDVLWQSFDHPSDTLLPGMTLGIDHKTGRNQKLTSWLRENNPAPGAFTLEWDPISGRLLSRRRGMPYWTSGMMKDYTIQSSNFQVKEFENFNIQPDPVNFNYNFTSVTSHDGGYFVLSLLIDPKLTPQYKRMVAGWKLEYDGMITDVGNGMLTKIATTSKCYGYSNQGTNKGCELWEQPKCRNHGQNFVLGSGIFRMANGLVASSTYDKNSSLSLSDCRDICWKDCNCAGYDDTSTSAGCRYWKGENLKFEQRFDGSVPRKYVLDSPPAGKNYMKTLLPAIIILTVLVFGIGLFVWRRRIKQGHVIKKRNEEVRELLSLEGYTENDDLENEGAKSNDLRLFTYAAVQSATNNFSSTNKLGEGGFGPVYKGKIARGGKDVAVKVLSQQSGQGLLEFKTELILISKLQHVNLVKLLGFCIHGNDKMIIYEYMPNKSLDFFLFSPSMREQLDWKLRFNIIEGIAQGLLYLHKYSRLKVVHRDLKPSNILLDENMNPKISDFGLARIFKQNINEANTEKCVGTFGYMAPEYAMHGIFSVKSDVYSFGVLVLEVVSGRKCNSYLPTEGLLNLVEHAWELWKTDSAVELMDPSLMATCETDQLIRCIHVGLLCVENHGTDRPTIEDVLEMLKNDAANLPKPQNPAFITSIRNEVVQVENTKPVKVVASTNQVTVSELAGR